MFSLNSANSVTKKLKIKRKIARLESRTSCVRDRDDTTRADPYTEPNSCLSDFSDSLNSLISPNSMKVLLHLEKTPLSYVLFPPNFTVIYLLLF